MSVRPRYVVFVERDGEHWLAEVAGLAGAHTYAESLDELRARTGEVVELMTDATDFDVEYRLPTAPHDD